ncbi:MAG TPA: hypothetical protein QF703_02475, partial [Candidatus Thalassarchaeaceae archaeon]|nr:hypothetical protein [Candidatus Thalassarchaeaceae archaeon]
GFDSKAIKEFWIDLGLTQKDIAISLQTVEAFNSSIIDSKAERRSFVVKPKIFDLEGLTEKKIVLSPKHPEGSIEGSRKFTIVKRVVVQSSDVKKKIFRLKEFADVEISGQRLKIQSEDRSDDRPIIHWIPEEHSTSARLLIPDGKKLDTVNGLIESSELEIGKTYQLERVGFARLDAIDDDGVAVLIWLHG